MWAAGPSAFVIASAIMTTTLYNLDTFEDLDMTSMGQEAQHRALSRELQAASSQNQVGVGVNIGVGVVQTPQFGGLPL
jgi:cytochrome c-type biogenesis protein CcmH/NrfF